MRKFKGLNILVIAVAFGLTFVGLVGASSLGYRLGTERPLDSFLKSREYISRYSTVDAGPELRLEVEVRKGADLKSAYREIVDGVHRITGNRNIQLVLLDRRDAHLGQVYHEMHFAIQEAIMTGQFTLMDARLRAIAQRQGLDGCSVTVDQENVYLQLVDGDHYLYQVVPRLTPGGPIASAGGPASPEKGGASPW